MRRGPNKGFEGIIDIWFYQRRQILSNMVYQGLVGIADYWAVFEAGQKFISLTGSLVGFRCLSMHVEK